MSNSECLYCKLKCVCVENETHLFRKAGLEVANVVSRVQCTQSRLIQWLKEKTDHRIRCG